MLWKMLILLLHCFQHSVAVYCINSINIVQFRSHDKQICTFLIVKSNVVLYVDLKVALHSALCGSMLSVMALIYNIDKGCSALLLIISNAVQNVNLIVALHSALFSSILAVIFLTL